MDNNEPGVENEITPYEIGRSFGRCATQILFNLPFNDQDDISIPESLRGNPEVQKGIRAGVKEIYEMLSQLRKQMKEGEVQ